MSSPLVRAGARCRTQLVTQPRCSVSAGILSAALFNRRKYPFSCAVPTHIRKYSVSCAVHCLFNLRRYPFSQPAALFNLRRYPFFQLRCSISASILSAALFNLRRYSFSCARCSPTPTPGAGVRIRIRHAPACMLCPLHLRKHHPPPHLLCWESPIFESTTSWPGTQKCVSTCEIEETQAPALNRGSWPQRQRS
jgi:hypothetical protein